jgi:hypothetical protein
MRTDALTPCGARWRATVPLLAACLGLAFLARPQEFVTGIRQKFESIPSNGGGFFSALTLDPRPDWTPPCGK